MIRDEGRAAGEMTGINQSVRKKVSEQGYLLLAVIFMLFLLILSLSIAMPKIREDIQRDRDLETMERGKQYVRAIQLYYRKFQTYPPNVDALVKTNEIRFLRKRYIDPTTGKDDWKPVQLGQNKTPTAMGFFGQPLAGTAVAGTGPSGGNGLNGTSPSTPGGGIFGNSSSGSSASNNTSTFSNNFSLGGTNSTIGSNGPTGTNTAGSGSDSGTGSDNGTGSPNGTGSTNGPTGQTFGGAGIIGFSPASPKQSILVFKKKNHYNEWEFTYNPLADTSMRIGNGGALAPPAGGNTGPFGTNSGTNNSGSNNTGTNNSSGGGNGSSLGGNSPGTPTTPTTPQQ